MAEVYLGEIRIFPYGRIPEGWVICDGAILPMQTYAALGSLLGNRFGGDGRMTFGIPDLRGRTIMGATSPTAPVTAGGVGASGGAESVRLTPQQMPAHQHMMHATSQNGTGFFPAQTYMAAPVPPSTLVNPPGPANLYGNTAPVTALHESCISSEGGSAPHENRQPFIALHHCMAVRGFYPQRP